MTINNFELYTPKHYKQIKNVNNFKVLSFIRYATNYVRAIPGSLRQASHKNVLFLDKLEEISGIDFELEEHKKQEIVFISDDIYFNTIFISESLEINLKKVKDCIASKELHDFVDVVSIDSFTFVKSAYGKIELSDFYTKKWSFSEKIILDFLIEKNILNITPTPSQILTMFDCDCEYFIKWSLAILNKENVVVQPDWSKHRYLAGALRMKHRETYGDSNE